MRQFFITVFGTIIGIFAFLFIIMFLLIGLGISAASSGGTAVKKKQVLSLDLRIPLRDHSPASSFFGPQPLSVVEITRALANAKDDSTVQGLFIRANGIGMVPASAEEIRLALEDFKSSGKFVITHAQGFDSPSIMPYHAVSASDEIWQQDTTGFAVAGLYSETEFYGGVFDKIDAQPQFDQFYEYKNAANRYTQTDFTPEHREASTSYLTSLNNNAVAQIAQDRGLSAETLQTTLESAPLSAEAALDAKMIDKLGQVEDVKAYIRDKVGDEKTPFTPINSYEIDSHLNSPTIAYIGGQGSVTTGPSADGSNPFIGGGLTMGSDTLAKAFDDAAKDDKVKAIVFRVSSPGGSPAASDQIYDAVARAQEAGIPVIISMGQYAASGGYYVSANADSIVAMPATITGSIGVLGGKIAFEDSFAKLGYNLEGISIGGDYAGAYSGDTPFNQSQKAAYHGQLEDIYEDFTNRVSEGRDIPLDRVKDIAKGRVWTGAQAKEIGLVDELGGFSKAVDIAKELADIDADSDVRLKRFPRPKTTAQQIEQLLGSSAQIQNDLSTLSDVMALPEVQAALALRQKSLIGQEMSAHLPEIK